MSIVTDILRTYRSPRAVQARRMEGVPREDRVLASLMAGCALIYVAQWPRLAREASVDPSVTVESLLAGALFAWLMVMPLVLYALALILAGSLKLIGGQATGYVCRAALAWALLASTPLWLFAGLLGGFAPGAGWALVSALALLAVVVFTGAGVSAVTQSGKELA